METNKTETASAQGCRIRKRTLRELMNMETLPERVFTMEESLHKAQIEKAEEGDTRSYLALMGLMYGNKIIEESGDGKYTVVFNLPDQQTIDLVKETKNQ